MKLKWKILKHQKMFAKTFILTGLFLLATNGFSQDPNFYVYLCFGQSNMEGAATIESQDQTEDSRFQVLQSLDCPNLGREKNIWYNAVPPVCQCWSGLSPPDYFGRTMIERLPDSIKVGVINVAVGGCDIRLFDKDIYQDYDSTFLESWFLDKIKDYGGNPYEHLINLAKIAQQDGIIKGILLHQGETNTGDSQWPSYVKKVYNDMLTDLSLDADFVPLLAGEVVHEDQGGVCASMNSIIAELPNTIPTAHVISSSGCTDKDDNLHFNSAGMRELGRRYAEKMLSIMNNNVPLIGNAENHLGGYTLEQNYPNPFNTKTSILYFLPQTSKVTLEILNIAGHTVKTLIDNVQSMGEHTITFDGSNLSSGIYIYQIRTSTGFIQNKKMHLVQQSK